MNDRNGKEERIERRLRELIEQRGLHSFPTYPDFKEARAVDLYNFVRHNGGRETWARRLDIPLDVLAEPGFEPLRNLTERHSTHSHYCRMTMMALATFLHDRQMTVTTMAAVDVNLFHEYLRERYKESTWARASTWVRTLFVEAAHAGYVRPSVALAAGVDEIQVSRERVWLQSFTAAARDRRRWVRTIARWCALRDKEVFEVTVEEVAEIRAQFEDLRGRDRVQALRVLRQLYSAAFAQERVTAAIAIAAGADPFDLDPRWAPLRAFVARHRSKSSRAAMRLLAPVLESVNGNPRALRPEHFAAVERALAPHSKKTQKAYRNIINRYYVEQLDYAAAANAIAAGADPFDVDPRWAPLRAFLARANRSNGGGAMRLLARVLESVNGDPRAPRPEAFAAALERALATYAEKTRTNYRTIIDQFYREQGEGDHCP